MEKKEEMVIGTSMCQLALQEVFLPVLNIGIAEFIC
jgi:hypothetical protein